MKKPFELTWREIFDCQNFKQFSAGVSINEVNHYVKTCTYYKYFIFNGLIYESHYGYYEEVNIEIVPDEQKMYYHNYNNV